MGIGAPAEAPRCVKRDVEKLRGAARIVVEHLVEIAHAIEQQHVRVLRLDAQVLLHHGGVVWRVRGHADIIVHVASADSH